MDEFLNDFVSAEKKELLSNIEEVSEAFEKVEYIDKYVEEIEKLKKQYDKLIDFSEILKMSIYQENPKIKKAILLKEALNGGLFIKYVKENCAFVVDKDRTTFENINDPEYRDAIQEMLVTLSDKLSKYTYAYQLKYNELKLKGWLDF